MGWDHESWCLRQRPERLQMQLAGTLWHAVARCKVLYFSMHAELLLICKSDGVAGRPSGRSRLHTLHLLRGPFRL